MKKCNDCNVAMIEETNLHTDYVGGVLFKEQLFLDYNDEINGSKGLFNNNKISIKRIQARVCPNCGKVELYVDLTNNK